MPRLTALLAAALVATPLGLGFSGEAPAIANDPLNLDAVLRIPVTGESKTELVFQRNGREVTLTDGQKANFPSKLLA